jgi:hypothetical protein
MEQNNQLQTQEKSLSQDWKTRLEETLSLSRTIINSSSEITQKELSLTISNTIGKPVLRDVFKGENGSVGFSVVRIVVKRFLNSFAFSTKHTDEQIDVMTVDTLERFSHESLEDVLLFFKMARAGRFGATKKGVDSNLIFGEWFPSYLELKSIERESQLQNEKNSRDSVSISMKDVEISYRKAMLRNLKKKESDFIDQFTKDMDRQMLEDTILSWSKDDELKKYIDLLKKKRRDKKK